VEKVIYPGLPSHPGYALAEKQMRGPGGMISFVVKGGEPAARALLKTVEVFVCAESLGGVESLIERRARYVGDASVAGPTLCRLSVGIENVDDLWADLDGALRAALA
jgi:cystathionine beta-lyase/cystathionine gamma-synthase